MTEREIDNIIKAESGMILLKKNSEETLLESVFLKGWVSLITALYFLINKKHDYVILTQKRIIVIIKNKKHSERFFNEINSLHYDGLRSIIEVSDKNRTHLVPLKRLRVRYDESKLIQQRIAQFRLS